jgi:hypothetical protein
VGTITLTFADGATLTGTVIIPEFSPPSPSGTLDIDHGSQRFRDAQGTLSFSLARGIVDEGPPVLTEEPPKK